MVVRWVVVRWVCGRCVEWEWDDRDMMVFMGGGVIWWK